MATPMTADQWLKALRAEGVTDIVEMDGWRTHNRNHKGPWGDVKATMVHHTAGEGSGLPGYVYGGSADLPGPVCHDFLARSGRLYLVGNGRANHAGTVARNAYNAVVSESATHPAPDADEPIDGNAMSYGLEVENSGAEGRDWPAKQYDVAVRVQAARCRVHGWSANSVWAHKEATRRKPVDPRIDMNEFRRDVAERLAHDAGWNPGTTPPKEDTDMTPAQAKQLAAIHGVITPYAGWDYKGKADTRDAFDYLRGTNRDVTALGKKVDALGTKVDAITSVDLTDAQLAALAEKLAAHPTLAEAISERVAEKLAVRLAN